MAKIKYPQIRTAKGIAVFPSVHKEATFKENGKVVPTGKYECKIMLNDKDAQKMIAQLEKLWDDAMENPAKYGVSESKMSKVSGSEPNLGFYEDKDGNTIFKTSCRTKWTDSAGKERKIIVPVFDAKAKPTSVEVSGGSTIKLQITLVPYVMSKTNYGVSLRLEAVQLLELKEWTKNPFDEEEGYEGMDDREEETAEESQEGAEDDGAWDEGDEDF